MRLLYFVVTKKCLDTSPTLQVGVQTQSHVLKENDKESYFQPGAYGGGLDCRRDESGRSRRHHA